MKLSASFLDGFMGATVACVLLLALISSFAAVYSAGQVKGRQECRATQ